MNATTNRFFSKKKTERERERKPDTFSPPTTEPGLNLNIIWAT
jgi:hypothetical protein